MTFLTSLTALFLGLNQASTTVYLDDLDLGPMTSGWGLPQAIRSVNGTALSLAGKGFYRGVGTCANSTYSLNLEGKGDRFLATVGVDDSVGPEGTVEFSVYGEKELIWRSGTLRKGSSKEVDVDITKFKQLTLVASDTGDGINQDGADWCDARFTSNDPSFRAVPMSLTSVDKTQFLYPTPSTYVAPDAPWIVIPVVFVRLSNDDGSNPGKISRYVIPSNVKALNSAYKYAKIRFVCDPEVDYVEVKNTFMNRDFDPQTGNFTDEAKKPPEESQDAHDAAREKLAWRFRDRFPLICRGGSVWRWQKAGRRWEEKPGGANYSNSNFYVANFGGGTDTNNYCHEIGHAFGLPHTFGDLEPTSLEDAARMIREAVEKGLSRDEALNIFDGDLPYIKDTAPDMHEAKIFPPRERWKIAPRVDIPVKFADGTSRTYTMQPDPFNIVSYWGEWRGMHPQAHTYLGHFSPDQLRVMRISAAQRFDDLHLTPDNSKAPAGIRLQFASATTTFDAKRISRVPLGDPYMPPESTPITRGNVVICQGKTGETVSFKFPNTIPAGKYRVWWAGGYAPDYGKFALSVNGKPLREFDAFLMNWRPSGWRNMGECEIAGKVEASFKVTGKHPLGTGSAICLGSLVLQKTEG